MTSLEETVAKALMEALRQHHLPHMVHQLNLFLHAQGVQTVKLSQKSPPEQVCFVSYGISGICLAVCESFYFAVFRCVDRTTQQLVLPEGIRCILVGSVHLYKHLAEAADASVWNLEGHEGGTSRLDLHL